MKMSGKSSFFSAALAVAALIVCAPAAQAAEIIHDAEYYILEAQNGEKWAADDKAVDAKLAEFRKKEQRQTAEHPLHPH